MAIIAGKEILRPYIKKAAGYIKSLISSQHVEMSDGMTLQSAIDKINNNLSYESGQIVMSGTPVGCTATILESNSLYVKIGKLVFFNAELTIGNNGTNPNLTVSIPCLPYNTKVHSTFSAGYQSCVVKANGSDNNTVLKAGAYGNGKNVYLSYSSGGRVWTASQKDIISGSGAILISGFYITDE